MSNENRSDSHSPQSPRPPSAATPTEANPTSHLSYPVADAPIADDDQPAPTQSRHVLTDRLYVGNLHPTVDEYTLLQVFSKFGKVSKLDFLFHRAGPAKGKPRGYAFVEYAKEEDALRALSSAHDKLLRGRKLVVTYAHQAPADAATGFSHLGGKRKGMSDAGRPTTLSLLKSSVVARHDSKTEDKIAKMEAKLRQLQADSSGTAAASKPLPAHPSLPPKPVAVAGFPGQASSSSSMAQKKLTPAESMRRSLPSLPIISRPKPDSSSHAVSFAQTRPRSGNASFIGLSGVRIIKHKDKVAKDDIVEQPSPS